MSTALEIAWLSWGAVLGSVELEAVRRGVMGRGPRAPSPSLVGLRVLVVRPCAGDASWLGRALSSVARARRTFDIAYRVAVASSADAAHEAATSSVEGLASSGVDASVVVTGASALNRKAAQLAAVVGRELATPDVVIVADSDIDLDGVDLDALVAPLIREPRAGAVWAPPVQVAAATGLGDRATAALLGGSLHAFPLLAELDRRALVGKLFAVRGEALRRIGGFLEVSSHLGEDIELARCLRTAGFSVEVAPLLARSLASGRAWSEAVERIARWITVIRAQRPLLLASYPMLFFATLPLAVLAPVAFRGSPENAIGAVASVLLARVLVAMAAAKAALRPWSLTQAIVDSALADLLLAVAFLRALGSRRVVWCGVTLTVDRAGRLEPERGP